jgi:phage gpG-like protein
VPDISVNVQGADAVAAALDRIALRMRTATRAAVTDATRLVGRRASVQLSRYYHPPHTPTPSPPGQPPARISGHLRGSLSPTGPYPTGGGFAGKLGPTAVYSRIQELGGQAGRNHSVTLPPRPYMRPTRASVISDGSLRRIFVGAWRRAL